MTRASDTPEPAAQADDALDDVVAACLESDAGAIDSAVERACREHPESGGEIRRRVELLRRVGLIRPAGVDGDERFPEELGEFRLIERLGGGGMGVVFRARQEPLGREVALKLIRPEHLYFPRARERFRRETEAVARLQHPGIVPIFTVGESNGMPFFAMELVRGSTLAEALRELRGRIPESLRGSDLARALRDSTPAWANVGERTAADAFQGSYVESVLRVTIQVADALHHAHSRGVLHRDVKPSNVAVTLDGRAQLLDFGLARFGEAEERMTLTRAEIGSLYYTSPEQLRNARGEVGARSDIYSLGVTLYELLALRLPFAEADADSARRAILAGAATPVRAHNRAVPRDLEVVCAKAMERDAARRYADAAAFALDLRNVLERRPIAARPVSAALQIRRWIQRHPVAATAIAAAIALPSALSWQQRAHARELQSALDDANAQRTIAQLEARDSKEINDFLVEVFSSVDPALAQGREVTARELLDQAAQRLESALADQPLVRMRLMNTIGESYTSLGEWQRAEAMFEGAIALGESAAMRESLPTAQGLSGLAMLELQLGRPGALEHARRAAEMHQRLATEPTFDLASTLMSYAMVLEETGDHDGAEATYREALAVVEKLPPPQLSARAGVWANLANVELSRGDPEAALAAGREAVRLQREVGPAPHPAITTGLNAAALALTRLERYDEARAVYDELLDEERKLTGEESARFAAFLTSQSNVEMQSGRSAEAIALLERAAAIFERVAPPAHEHALVCREKLAHAYQRTARWSDALATYQELAATIEAAPAAAGWRALMAHAQIALCHEAQGNAAAAERELSAALARARDARDPGDDGWEATAAAIAARIVALGGDLESARALVTRARALRDDSTLSTGAAAWTRLAAGIVAECDGDRGRARRELEPLAALERGPRFGESVPAIARARLAALLAKDDADRARELASRACTELERELGAEHPQARATAALLASLRR